VQWERARSRLARDASKCSSGAASLLGMALARTPSPSAQSLRFVIKSPTGVSGSCKLCRRKCRQHPDGPSANDGLKRSEKRDDIKAYAVFIARVGGDARVTRVEVQQ